MKTFILSCVFILTFSTAKSQIYAPGYAGYVGMGTIYYPNGVYQGGVYNGFANGNGVFYWADGSFFSGQFSAGFYNGPGLLVSRLYGYVTGCWSGGVFVGQCVGVYNPYQTQQAVRSEVQNVQSSLPQDSRVVSRDPDNYSITELNVNSQQAQQLLGRGF